MPIKKFEQTIKWFHSLIDMEQLPNQIIPC